ncbi:hypothetical protein ACWF94_03770 [Streptomyces sp. NPDC055078]
MKSALIRFALPAGLVGALIAAGLVSIGVSADDADRTASTRIWGKSAAAPVQDPTPDTVRSPSAFGSLLLPVPDGYRLGPDLELFGNDDERSGEQAVALLKAESRGLTEERRRANERSIDRLGILSVATRSFTSVDYSLVVQVRLVRSRNVQRMREYHDLRTQLARAVGLSKGPKIKGHPQAVCHLPSADLRPGSEGDEDTGLNRLSCSAHTSGVLVTVVAQGVNPFDKSAVAELLKRQLDRIASQGERI